MPNERAISLRDSLSCWCIWERAQKDLQKTNQRLEDVNGASDYSLETIKLLQDMSTLGSICRSLEESIARTEQIMAGVPYTESTLSQGPMMTTAAVVASQRVEGATAAASPVSAVVDSGFAIKQF